jgi:hypothetical protein
MSFGQRYSLKENDLTQFQVILVQLYPPQAGAMNPAIAFDSDAEVPPSFIAQIAHQLGIGEPSIRQKSHAHSLWDKTSSSFKHRLIDCKFYSTTTMPQHPPH